MGKITNEIRKLVIDSYVNEGMSTREVGIKFNIDKSTVGSIIGPSIRTISDSRYVRAKRMSLPVSHEQRQCLLGSLLGDGSIGKYGKARSYVYTENHSIKQMEYLKHKQSLLKVKKIYIRCRNKKSFSKKPIISLTYRNVAALEEISNVVIINNKKTVNHRWLDHIDTLGLAYWYMDDGWSVWKTKSRRTARVGISTMGFNIEENMMLVDFLRKKFGIESHLTKCKGGSRVTLLFSASGGRKFMKLIEPHIIQPMMYKIKFGKMSNNITKHDYLQTNKQKIMDLYKHGHSIYKISKQFKSGFSTISKLVKTKV